MMTAVPVPKCQPTQARVSVYPQPAGAAGGAQIKTQTFEQHASMPSNSLQISTPTSESNSLISALAFERPPSASAPWGSHIGFASSPTMALPMNSGWFALAQVPVPTPVVSGNIVKSEPDQGQAASSDLSRNEDRGGTGEKAAKRPKIDIPEEGFHQVVAIACLLLGIVVVRCPRTALPEFVLLVECTNFRESDDLRMVLQGKVIGGAWSCY